MTLAAVLTVLCGAVTVALALTVWFCRRHLRISGLATNGFKNLDLAFSTTHVQNVNFPHADSTADYWFGLAEGKSFMLSAADVRVRISFAKIRISIGTLKLFLPAANVPRLLYNRTNGRSWLASLAHKHILRPLAKLLSVNVHECLVLLNMNHDSTVDSEQPAALNLVHVHELHAPSLDYLKFSLTAQQVLATQSSLSKKELLRLNNIACTYTFKLQKWTVETTESIHCHLSTSLLHSTCEILKHAQRFKPSSEANSLSEQMLVSLPKLELKIPFASLVLELPTAEAENRVFQSLSFTFKDGTVQTKGNRWIAQAAEIAVTAQYDDAGIGEKTFCPVDRLLRRNAQSLLGKECRLVTASSVACSNASINSNLSDPDTASQLLDSILQKLPDWSVDAAPASFDRFKRTISQIQHEGYRGALTQMLNIDSAPARQQALSITVASLDFFVPFEFPFANLIDHVVVLFKAGLQPLSSKTEEGYWEGDGDFFFHSDWSFHLFTLRTSFSAEDDPFEARLGNILRRQQELAESRSRLEKALQHSCPPGPCIFDTSSSAFQDKHALAQSLAIGDIADNQVGPLLALHEQLFARYRALIKEDSKARPPPLVQLILDDWDFYLSWSKSFLNGPQNLHSLLNAMEGGDAISAKDVQSMTTLLGGLSSIRSSAVQLNVRNFARPLLLTPHLFVLGPIFLVEAPVRDPKVLIRYPVRLYPPKMGNTGIVHVLRSIQPLKFYHCIYASICEQQLCQITATPFAAGPLAMLDRVLDRFIKASIEDPSPPLPAWDKMRYNLRGCHSRLSISSPCLVSYVANQHPLDSDERLDLFFPKGLELGATPRSSAVLLTPGCTLGLHSEYLALLKASLQKIPVVWKWDCSGCNGLYGLPLIQLTVTRLEAAFVVRNEDNAPPLHHWTISPTTRDHIQPSEIELHDTFTRFRSKTICLVVKGQVGCDGSNDREKECIKWLYYREVERWISRYLLAYRSDIDCVKAGPLHQCSAVPERQVRTSFASVFTELHLFVHFADLFMTRLMNFSGLEDYQALWIASQKSDLEMHWRKGVLDASGHADWCYYYGEVEFRDVDACVSGTAADPSSNLQSCNFPLKIDGLPFYDFMRASRLLYLTLDEKCFRFDPEALATQCTTIAYRKDELGKRISALEAGFPSPDLHSSAQEQQSLPALASLKHFYEAFLAKCHYQPADSISFTQDSELADTTHYGIHSAQLIWNVLVRGIVFKLVDELFVAQKKAFSQGRSGLNLMRKMDNAPLGTQPLSVASPTNIPSASSPHSPRNDSFCMSPTDAVDFFFEQLLARKSSLASPVEDQYETARKASTGAQPFLVPPERQRISKGEAQDDSATPFDVKAGTELREIVGVEVPRIVDVTFFNPQFFLITSEMDATDGAVLVTAERAQVLSTPVWDGSLDRANSENSSGGTADPKIGTRTKIALTNSTILTAPRGQFRVWPEKLLGQCRTVSPERIIDTAGLQPLSDSSSIVLIYDVSNPGYVPGLDVQPAVPASLRKGDSLSVKVDGWVLRTTSWQFRIFLDVIINLLVYRDPNEETRAEKLETLLIAANLTERRLFARQMASLRTRLDHIRLALRHRKLLEISDSTRFELLAKLDGTERDLALITDALRTLQNNFERINQKRSRLTLTVAIGEIKWALLVPQDPDEEPNLDRANVRELCQVVLDGIHNKWISKEDGSMENVFQISDASVINRLPSPFYRTILRAFSYEETDAGNDGKVPRAIVNYGSMVRFFVKSRLPVNGINVFDHVELDLSPLQIQLTYEMALSFLRFFLPNLPDGPSHDDDTSSIRSLNRSLSVRDLSRQNSLLSDKDRLVRTRTVFGRELSTFESIAGADGLDEAYEMKLRSQQNAYFVYVKVPSSQHLLSYKGTGKTSIVDINRFVLSLPEFEYQGKLWSWPEFLNQLRKDTMMVLLRNAGSLFKDKLRKWGRRNMPEDEQYIRRKLADDADANGATEADEAASDSASTGQRRLELALPSDTEEQRIKKTFLLFGKTLQKAFERKRT